MRSLAAFLQRFPWIVALMRVGFRLIQARFTAGVVGIVMDEQGRILLVEHVFHPYCPWGLPGGWVDRHENPMHAVQRELKEELGLAVEVDCLVHMDMNEPGHLDFAYACSSQGQVQNLSYELLSYRWCSLDDLPRLQKFHYRAITQMLAQKAESNPS
jgi:ADP-ribose pyrophosphatase YjhB (NUDIX family)